MIIRCDPSSVYVEIGCRVPEPGKGGKMLSVTENDLMLDALSHVGERCRKRKMAYYVCRVCDNQFVFGIPQKERICPVCLNCMHLVSVVDEFELHRMDSWSGGILRAKDIGQQVKEKVLGHVRKELC